MVSVELHVATTQIMSSFVQVCFLNFILYMNVNDYILYRFCGCSKSFLWLGKNINKKNNVNGHDSDTDLCPYHDAPRPSKTS